MKRTCLVLFALAMAMPVFAQDIKVVSGSHAGFDRLVLEFDAGADWTFGRVDGGYEFRHTNRNLNFDLTDVFQRISRDKFKDARNLRDGRLFIQTDCECHAEVFIASGGRVAIDLKDGAAPATSRFEGRLADLPVERNSAIDEGASVRNMTQPTSGRIELTSLLPLQSSITFLRPPLDINPEPALDENNTRPPAEPLATPAIPRDELVPVGNGQPGPSADGGSGSTQPSASSLPSDSVDAPPQLFGQSTSDLEFPTGIFAELPNHEQERVSDAQAALIKQIQRAVAQGLLDVVPQELTVPTIGTLEAASQPEPDEPVAVQHIADPPQTQHVFVETSADRDALDPVAQALRSNAVQNCLPSAWFAVEGWGPDPSKEFMSLEALRANLVGEFDKPDEQAILALARRYIYLGFGAEANQLLNVFDVSTDASKVLRVLAEAIDKRKDSENTQLDQQLNCSTPAALWALVSNPELAITSEIAEKAITSTFSQLPLHLRNDLGPAVVDALVNAGKPDLARTIRAAIARSADADASALNLIDAKIEVQENGIQSAVPLLEIVVAEDGPQAAEALAQVIEDRIRTGLAIDQELAASADALAVAYRGTALGERLTKAAIRALSVSGQPDTTLLRIDAAMEKGAIAPGEAEALRAETFEFVAKNGSDVEFVKFAFKYELNARSRSTATQSARISMMDRLLILGFAERAKALLNDVAPSEIAERDLLQARMAIADEEYENAISLIGDNQSPEAKILAAKAYEKLGQFGLASNLFREVGLNEEVQRIAWQQGEWSEISASSGKQKAAAARLALENRATNSELVALADPDQPAPLAAGTELVARSEGLRSLLVELMGE